MRTARAAAAAIALLLGVVDTGAWAQGRAASVLVERVEIRAIADTAPVIGQLVASTQADVASRRAGVASNVLFEIGDSVVAGEPLVRLETKLNEIERASAEADLAVAEAGQVASQARVQLAIQALQRQSRLRGSTAFSPAIVEDLEQEVEQAQGDLARASAQIAASQARMARVDYDLEYSIIRAPFSGIVVERMAQPGQYVNTGEAVAKLLDTGGLEIEADVPAELIPGLSKGTEVEVVLADGANGTARVRVALPVETIATRTRPVRFETVLGEIDPMLLAVGKSVTLKIPTSAPRDVLTVPKDALVQGRGGGWIVYVVIEGQAQPKSVTLGQAAGGRLEVIDGLSDGDVVVVRGNERLRPGQEVNATLAGG